MFKFGRGCPPNAAVDSFVIVADRGRFSQDISIELIYCTIVDISAHHGSKNLRGHPSSGFGRTGMSQGKGFTAIESADYRSGTRVSQEASGSQDPNSGQDTSNASLQTVEAINCCTEVHY